MKVPSLSSVAQLELLSPLTILSILLISFLYLSLSLFLLNYELVSATLVGSSPVLYKLVLLATLLQGLFTAFSPLDTVIMLVNALLVGITLVLMVKTVNVLGQNGKLHVSVGGATLVGLVTSGCASCGFSVLSILGLGTSLSFLPFHGLELHLIALATLLFSSWYMLKKLREGKYCRR